MQNKPQSLAKCTRQSYISRWEKQRGSLGAEPLADGGKWGFEGGAPNTVAIMLLFFPKTHIFRYISV